MKHGIMLCVAAALLSGCATGAPISNIAVIRAHDTSITGIDVYEKRRKRGEKVPQFRGDQFVTVRTYQEDPEGEGIRGKELLGADCRLQGAEYSATIKTPAKVRVPIYGYESTDISVECTHKDYQKVAETKRSYDKTKSDNLNAGAGAGLAGLVFMVAVNAATDETKHVFLYPDIHLVMRSKIKRKGPRI